MGAEQPAFENKKSNAISGEIWLSELDRRIEETETRLDETQKKLMTLYENSSRALVSAKEEPLRAKVLELTSLLTRQKAIRDKLENPGSETETKAG